MNLLVPKWPTSIETEAGIICNPTPEQCREHGYELLVPPTAAETAATQAAAAERERVRLAYVETLRGVYRSTALKFCALAGISAVTKFEDTSTIQAAIDIANAGQDVQKALQLTQLAMLLDNTIDELRRKDGDTAWERI